MRTTFFEKYTDNIKLQNDKDNPKMLFPFNKNKIHGWEIQDLSRQDFLENDTDNIKLNELPFKCSIYSIKR